MRKAKFSIIFFLISTSLVFTTYVGVLAGMQLRNKSKKLNEKDIKATVTKLNFFDKKLNEGGDFPNDFADNGNRTVTDQASGLMWEQKGSEKKISWYDAKKYVKELNKKKFAGHSDWRIPTIEELYSLLQPNSNQQLYIDKFFDTKLSHCWSIDKSDMETGTAALNQIRRRLTLDFKEGTVSDAFTDQMVGGASATNVSSFVRAVRSVK